VPPLPDGTPVGTLILAGLIGSAQWPGFAASREARDGAPDPLDRWSRRLIDGLAAELGAAALYPFGGSPYHPFQRWARRAEPVFPSPLGMLVHPEFGLWHSYRGALLLSERWPLPRREVAKNPCDGCADRPCLSACPVGAFFRPGAYDERACASHLEASAGSDCRSGGCLARRACPVGREHAYGSEQARFYIDAFVAARRSPA